MHWDYFTHQEDYDEKRVAEMFESSNEITAVEYFKPFEARFTVHILHKLQNGIFDFGAGYTVYKDKELFSMVKSAFMPFENVILLRYSSNSSERLESLRNRHEGIMEKLYNALNSEFINSSCNEILAKQVIDTKGLSIGDISDIIIPRLRIA